MKKFIFGLFLATLSLLLGNSSVKARDLFVATNGNDANSGSIDQPLATLSGAKDKIKSLGIAGKEVVNVFMRSGTYELPSTITFDSQDSGSATYPVTYQAYQSDVVIISGGKLLTGWQANSSGNWQTIIPSGLPIPRQLWINNVRMVRAKTNVSGWTLNSAGTGFTTSTAFTTPNPGDIEVVYRGGWHEQRCSIDHVSGNQVIMKNPCWNAARSTNWPIDAPTWLENNIAFLDSPGEWFTDPRTRIITYKPKSTDSVDTAKITIPVLDKTIVLQGTSSSPVHNITFKNLIVAYGTWSGASSTYGFPERQANVLANWKAPITPAINLTYANNIILNHVDTIHQGGIGIGVTTGSKNILITNSRFQDISSAAITIASETATNNSPVVSVPDQETNITVSNNYITDTGAEFSGSTGIMAGFVNNLHIEHNTMFNFPYSAISVGWGWGKSDPTFAGNNNITNNLIVDFMKTLSDGGAIYTLSAQPGTVIENNVIYHENKAAGGIYPDQGSRFITYNLNVIARATGESTNIRSVLENGGGNTYTNNYWEDPFLFNNPNFQMGCSVNGVAQNCGADKLTNNHIITTLSQAPTNLINDSGVECQYRRPIMESGIGLPISHGCPVNPPTTPPTPSPSKPGDISSDGVNYIQDGFVNQFDNTRFKSDFGKTGTTGFIRSDIDKNGKVDIFDYNILVSNYGK